MPKVLFKFDKEKDLWNIWETCNSDSKWYNHKESVSPILLEICEGKKFEECKKELEEFRSKIYNSKLIKPFVNSLQQAWDTINDRFFEKLEKIMKLPIVFDEVISYITTVNRCPYDFKENPWFMVSFFKNILNALVTCGHEIMHIQFHNTYWDYVKKEIGEDKTAHLKEALTVLLNSEFSKDFWFVNDEGYPVHKELRKFIEEEWKKEPDFDILLNKCIKYLKDNDVSLS